jgi:hypothetical protein
MSSLGQQVRGQVPFGALYRKIPGIKKFQKRSINPIIGL